MHAESSRSHSHHASRRESPASADSCPRKEEEMKCRLLPASARARSMDRDPQLGVWCRTRTCTPQQPEHFDPTCQRDYLASPVFVNPHGHTPALRSHLPFQGNDPGPLSAYKADAPAGRHHCQGRRKLPILSARFLHPPLACLSIPLLYEFPSFPFECLRLALGSRWRRRSA